MTVLNLSEIEKKAFKSVFSDGLVDIFLGFFVFEFAIMLFLNDMGLSDFWSSMTFLPVNLFGLLLLRIAKQRITVPRIGFVKFGEKRKRKSRILLIWLILFLLLGVIFSLVVSIMAESINWSSWFFPLVFALLLFSGFTIAGLYLDIPRFRFYGLWLAGGVIIGELLYRYQGFSHHGLPVVFITSGGMIMIVGIILLVRFVNTYPLSDSQ